MAKLKRFLKILQLITILLVATPNAGMAGGDMAGNGGDIVICGRVTDGAKGTFHTPGIHALDYFDRDSSLDLLDANVVPGETQNDKALGIMQDIVATRLPEEYRKSYLEHVARVPLTKATYRIDLAAAKVWQVRDAELTELRDDSLIWTLPKNCLDKALSYEGIAAGKYQAVLRVSAEDRIVYKVPRKIWDLLSGSALAMSMIVTHEWLWDFMTKSADIYELNNALHADAKFLPSDLAEQVRARFARAGERGKPPIPTGAVVSDRISTAAGSPKLLFATYGPKLDSHEQRFAFLRRLDEHRLIYNERHNTMAYNFGTNDTIKLLGVHPDAESHTSLNYTFLSTGYFDGQPTFTESLEGAVCVALLTTTSAINNFQDCRFLFPMGDKSFYRVKPSGYADFINFKGETIGRAHPSPYADLSLIDGKLFGWQSNRQEMSLLLIDPQNGTTKGVATFKNNGAVIKSFDINFGRLVYIAQYGKTTQLYEVDLYNGKHVQIWPENTALIPVAVVRGDAKTLFIRAYDPTRNAWGIFQMVY